MSRILTVEDILSAPDMAEIPVEVPEWGGSVMVAPLSQGDYNAVSKAAMVEGVLDSERLQILLFIHGVKQPKFTMEHYEPLRAKSAGAMTRVLSVVMEKAGLTKEAQGAAKAAFPEGVSGSGKLPD